MRGLDKFWGGRGAMRYRVGWGEQTTARSCDEEVRAVVLVWRVSGSFDCEIHDETVNLFAQDDGVWGVGGEQATAKERCGSGGFNTPPGYQHSTMR